MANRVKQLAFVVGMDKGLNVQDTVGVTGSATSSKSNIVTCYRVLLARIEEVGPKTYNWSFVKKMLDEKAIMASMKKGLQWANVKYADGKLKGSSGELSRFTSSKVNRPIVIISRFTDGKERTLGYKVADYDGNVVNKSIGELISYGTKITAKGGIPVQNAKFMGVSEQNKKAFYSAFPGCNFIEEIIERKKNTKNTEIKRVNTTERAKSLNKLTDIYSAEQIKELKGGKKEGIDIRIYANPQLSAKQMNILRHGLKNKVNVKPIAFPEFKEDAMAYYVADLIHGLDIRPYVNSRFSAEQLACLSTAYELGLDLGNLVNPDLSAEEMEVEKNRLASKLWRAEEVETDSSWKSFT